VVIPGLAMTVLVAVEAGLEAVAVLDAKGKPVAVAGALDDDEARALAAAVTHRLRGPDLLGRMLDGEMVDHALGARAVSVGIAARTVFVVVVRGRDRAAADTAIDDLRREVERLVQRTRADMAAAPPRSPGAGGSSSGPAELPLIELGVTVPRRDRN
jgi:hypothetical protein